MTKTSDEFLEELRVELKGWMFRINMYGEILINEIEKFQAEQKKVNNG